MRGVDFSPPPVRVAVRLLDHFDVSLPAYQTEGAAGMDLRASFTFGERADGRAIPPGEWTLVPTGIAVAVPQGFELQIRPRSGLALEHGVTVLNAPGTIDSDYRGEIGVMLINLGPETFVAAHGARVAQAVLSPVARVEWAERSELPHTPRDQGGFGSTGR